jgi:hypothetical protein
MSRKYIGPGGIDASGSEHLHLRDGLEPECGILKVDGNKKIRGERERSNKSGSVWNCGDRELF